MASQQPRRAWGRSTRPACTACTPSVPRPPGICQARTTRRLRDWTLARRELAPQGTGPPARYCQVRMALVAWNQSGRSSQAHRSSSRAGSPDRSCCRNGLLRMGPARTHPGGSSRRARKPRVRVRVRVGGSGLGLGLGLELGLKSLSLPRTPASHGSSERCPLRTYGTLPARSG